MNASIGYLDEQAQQRLVPVEQIVRLEGVSKVFTGRHGAPVTALDGIDLAVPQGSVLGVIGRSGAGKSTLIRLVNGLEKPSSGRVVVDGSDIAVLPEAALRHARRSIGMIFQHFNLLSSRTAAENIALPLEVAGFDKAAIRTRVEELLALVGLSDKHNRYPAELSGGQKQRVGIARALATKPKVLLSDEATSALDPETTRSILELLVAHQRGTRPHHSAHHARDGGDPLHRARSRGDRGRADRREGQCVRRVHAPATRSHAIVPRRRDRPRAAGLHCQPTSAGARPRAVRRSYASAFAAPMPPTRFWRASRATSTSRRIFWRDPSTRSRVVPAASSSSACPRRLSRRLSAS